MASELQHCPTCEEEYVAGVAACVECGGPLTAGPLEYFAARERGGSDAPPAVSAVGRPDQLLAELPGLQAHHAVRALLLEDITCALKCQGVEKVYVPGQPPAEPFAVTLLVRLYVSQAQLEAAQEIIASFGHEDVIGEQWSDVEADDAGSEVEAEVDAASASQPDDLVTTAGEPASESTSWRVITLVVLAAVVLFLLFGR